MNQTIIVRIIEITFERPWSLITHTPRTDHVKQDLKKRGFNQTMVYEKSDDDTQIVFIAMIKNCWEVHHLVFDSKTGEFISGTKIQTNNSSSICLVSTMMELCKKRLERGQSVRITAPPELWKNYETIIKRIVKLSNGRLNTDKIDRNYVGADGVPCVAQEIKFVTREMISPMRNAL